MNEQNKLSYSKTLRDLQIDLVKLQRHVVDTGMRVLIILEGRDTSGKDGTIKRLLEYLPPRHVRSVALPKPSDRQVTQWYFQRYAEHLPAGGEMVVFNRSWYNRAGVERVMGFCNENEYRMFMALVLPFESMLIQSGISLIKYYLDVSRDEQAARLDARKTDPLRQWKISPVDQAALEKYDEYSEARDAMLERTSAPISPWTVVLANDKQSARLNLIADLLDRIDYADKNPPIRPDRGVAFRYSEADAGCLHR